MMRVQYEPVRHREVINREDGNALVLVQDAIPRINLAGMDILDIGCGDGAVFLHPAFKYARRLCGIDIKESAILRGRKLYPRVEFEVGSADDLSMYPDRSFDVIMCRVALPYMHIPRVLAEIARIARPNATVYLTLHGLMSIKREIGGAIKNLAWKRLIDHCCYTLPMSALMTLGVQPLPRPFRGTYESFQSPFVMRRWMRKYGFDEIMHGNDGQNFIMTAVRNYRVW